MHEFSLVKDLMHKILSLARKHHARKVTGVTVKLGALSHISPDHLQEHFTHTQRGTVAEGARLNIRVVNDVTDPYSQGIQLEYIEIEE